MRTKDMDLNGKEPVRLRRKKLRNGDYSLYLDVYWNGKRSYEFLKLYLSGEWGKAAIEKNKPIIEIAQQIKHKRILSLRMVKYGPSNILPRPSFLEFFTELADQRAKYKNNSENWAGALKHLTTFIGNKNPRLDEIDDAWLTEFKYYLLEEHKEKGKRSLMANTAHSYFNKVRSALTNAFDRNLIEKNPAALVSAIRVKESKREFLTITEVRKLAEAPCEELYLKEAFLFSVLTGLRWSDIFHLTWNEIHENENGAYIHLEQKKTNKYLVLPITNEALQLLGERKEPVERIFNFLRYSSQTSVCLSRWMLKAGITKKITFHAGRHTHATLLLSKGVDISTVSKLLGHRHLKSTERYAHITDNLKIEAINKLSLIPTEEG